ncbi:MAG: hypothetical protein V4538_15630 [Bacteroidota bacterium]
MKKITLLLVFISSTIFGQGILLTQLQKITPGNVLIGVGTGTNGVITQTNTIPFSMITGTTSLITTTNSITINGVSKPYGATTPTFTVGDLFSTSSYTNPSWLSSLAWSKITGTPTTISGYGITDPLINGNLTTYKIPVAVSSNSLINGTIKDSSGIVSIGNTTDLGVSESFRVKGHSVFQNLTSTFVGMYFQNQGGYGGVIRNYVDRTHYDFDRHIFEKIDMTTLLDINAYGNNEASFKYKVGIGGNFDPAEALHVNGNVRINNLTASKLIYSDASKNIADLNIGSGLSLTGSTLSATGTSSTTILTASTNITISGSAPNYTISTPTQTTGLIGLTNLLATSPINYNNSTGVFTIQPSSTSQSGALSSTDWNTFNGKQAAINGTGFIKATGTTISYDNSTYLTAAGDVSVSATQTLTNKTLTAPSISSATLTGITTQSTTNYTGAVNDFKGADIASSATVAIGAATGNYVHITGTVTITNFDAAQAGTMRTTVFDNTLTVTTSTNIILPNSLSVATSTNDVAIWRSEGSGVWRLINYQKNSDTYLTWSPSFTGFSADPSAVTARYTVIGKTVTCYFVAAAGTSNAAGFTMTLPFTAANTNVQPSFAIVTDNGTTTTGYIRTAANSNIATVFKGVSATFTTSGSKNTNFTMVYEMQ